MNPAALLFDGALALALPLLAWAALASRDLFQAVVLFIVFTLALAFAWVRLAAPDVAIAEAAIGAGFTGALLLDALGQFGVSRKKGATGRRFVRRSPQTARGFTLALGALIAGLVWATTSLPETIPGLSAIVHQHLDDSGVSHAVTAVLLNYRGYDTLLEVGVLLVAVIGAWSVHRVEFSAPDVARPTPLLLALERWLAPVMIVTAGYLLWRGSHAPGGAFQAGAVLGAMAVLLLLAGVVRKLSIIGLPLRVLPVLGFAIFLSVGSAVMFHGMPLLTYPRGWATELILLVESALMISIGAILALLFAGVPPGKPHEP